MFEGIVKTLAEGELQTLLKHLDAELDGVMMRLRQQTTSRDSLMVLSATQQIELLNVWRPMVKGMIKRLEPPPAQTQKEEPAQW